MRARAALVLLALAASLSGLATGCTSRSAPLADYVALGDSFTSGAGLAGEVADAGVCQQSRLGYPYLVAAELDLELVNASCGGATTHQGREDQQRPGREPWPPQLDSVQESTDLVTVGFGYNDFAIYGDALFGCAGLATKDPLGSPCRDRNQAVAERSVAALGPLVEQLLDDVRDRAPDARVLLVGYPQLVPASGSCPELPLAAGDYAYVRQLLIDLDRVLRTAAEASGATYVDVMSASQGHDICAGADAWLSGAGGSSAQRAPYHPLAAGQEAVAGLVLAALR